MVCRNPTARMSQHPTGRAARDQFTIREPKLGSKIGPLDVNMRRVFVLKEHEELEAAEPLDFRHPSFPLV